MKRMPGATDDEIIEEVLRIASGGGQWTAYDRRTTSAHVREIVVEIRSTPGPTFDEIEAKRAELEKAGRPSG